MLGNTIKTAKNGVYIRQSDNNEFSENTLSDLHIGAKLFDGAINNRFIENNLIGTYTYSIYSEDENSINYLGPNGIGENTSNKIASR